jgi:hypothetical protein
MWRRAIACMQPCRSSVGAPASIPCTALRDRLAAQPLDRGQPADADIVHRDRQARLERLPQARRRGTLHHVALLLQPAAGLVQRSAHLWRDLGALELVHERHPDRPLRRRAGQRRAPTHGAWKRGSSCALMWCAVGRRARTAGSAARVGGLGRHSAPARRRHRRPRRGSPRSTSQLPGAGYPSPNA